MNEPYLMQRWIKVGNAVPIVAVALLLASCGASTQSRQTGSREIPDANSIEDSGKRLSGEFVLSAVEDAYLPNNAAQFQPQSVLSFDESGSFRRQDKSRVEEGAYLIGMQNELVLYIEKINGELLPAARVERYVIIDQRDDSITLRSGTTKTMVLKKR